jgi:ribosomal protein L17
MSSQTDKPNLIPDNLIAQGTGIPQVPRDDSSQSRHLEFKDPSLNNLNIELDFEIEGSDDQIGKFSKQALASIQRVMQGANKVKNMLEGAFSFIDDGVQLVVMLPALQENSFLGGLTAATLGIYKGSKRIKAISDNFIEPTLVPAQVAVLTGIRDWLISKPTFTFDQTNASSMIVAALWMLTAYKCVANHPHRFDRSVIPDDIAGSTPKSLVDQSFGLVSGALNESTQKSCIGLLRLVINRLTKQREQECLSYILSQKIAWGRVMMALPHTEKMEKKKGKIFKTHIYTPPECATKSVWLSKKEHSHLVEILKDQTFELSKWRKDWIELTAENQHQYKRSFERQIKEAYKQSDETHRQVLQTLGHRKTIIEKLIKDNPEWETIPKKKRNTYLMVQHFYKHDILKSGSTTDKWVFNPSHYLAFVVPEIDEIISEFFKLKDLNKAKEIDSNSFGHRKSRLCKLGLVWLDLADPDLSNNKPAGAHASGKVTVSNRFSILQK